MNERQREIDTWIRGIAAGQSHFTGLDQNRYRTATDVHMAQQAQAWRQQEKVRALEEQNRRLNEQMARYMDLVANPIIFVPNKAFEGPLDIKPGAIYGGVYDDPEYDLVPVEPTDWLLIHDWALSIVLILFAIVFALVKHLS